MIRLDTDKSLIELHVKLKGVGQEIDRMGRFWVEFTRLVERYGWTFDGERQALRELDLPLSKDLNRDMTRYQG